LADRLDHVFGSGMKYNFRHEYLSSISIFARLRAGAIIQYPASPKTLKNMTFQSLEPFIPSGKNFEGSKQLFMELGFVINWEAGGYVGFEKDACKFILQDYHNPGFAENLMINVKVDNAEAFWKLTVEKKLPERFGVRITAPAQQPYGKEVSLIDMAGVCWHFVE